MKKLDFFVLYTVTNKSQIFAIYHKITSTSLVPKNKALSTSPHLSEHQNLPLNQHSSFLTGVPASGHGPSNPFLTMPSE